MLVKSYFSALDRGATQKKNDRPAVTATRSGGITSGNRKLGQGRDLSINSGRNLKGIRKLSPHLGGELSGSGSIGGNNMSLLELEFSNKVDLKALNLTVENIQDDLKLLDKWGFDFNRNILSYIHEVAEALRYCESED